MQQDIGYGSETNARNKASAFEKARKTAVTDATKRALRNFGNALGNCLYDTPYLGGIGKMAKPQVSTKYVVTIKKKDDLKLGFFDQIKFVPKNLYRHEQFESPKPEATAPPPKTLPQPWQQASSSRVNQPVKSTVQPPKTTPVHIPSSEATSSTSYKTTPAITQQKIKEEQAELARKSLFEPVIPEDSFSYGKRIIQIWVKYNT